MPIQHDKMPSENCVRVNGLLSTFNSYDWYNNATLSEEDILKALVMRPQIEALVDSLLSPNVFAAIEDEYKFSQKDNKNKVAEDFFKFVFAELYTRLGKPYYNSYRHPKRVVNEYAQWSLDNGFNIVLKLKRDTWTRKAIFDLLIVRQKDQPP